MTDSEHQHSIWILLFWPICWWLLILGWWLCRWGIFSSILLLRSIFKNTFLSPNNPIYQVSTYTLSMQMLWTFWFPEHQSKLLQRNIIEKTSVAYQWCFWASPQLLSFGYPGGQKSGTQAENLKIFWWKHQMLIDTCAFLLICSGVVVSSKAQLQTTVEFSKVY
jgi:hypothetical protein